MRCGWGHCEPPGPQREYWGATGRRDARSVAVALFRTVGIVRQGLTADRSGFSRRLWGLRDWPMPGTVLVLMADEVRLRHSRRVLARTSAPAILALERDAVLAGADDPVWRPTSGNADLDLRRELRRMRPGGELPWEKPLSRATVPGDVAPDADHALPPVTLMDFPSVIFTTTSSFSAQSMREPRFLHW